MTPIFANPLWATESVTVPEILPPSLSSALTVSHFTFSERRCLSLIQIAASDCGSRTRLRSCRAAVPLSSIRLRLRWSCSGIRILASPTLSPRPDALQSAPGCGACHPSRDRAGFLHRCVERVGVTFYESVRFFLFRVLAVGSRNVTVYSPADSPEILYFPLASVVTGCRRAPSSLVAVTSIPFSPPPLTAVTVPLIVAAACARRPGRPRAGRRTPPARRASRRAANCAVSPRGC